jgi:hypothetical protein
VLALDPALYVGDVTQVMYQPEVGSADPHATTRPGPAPQGGAASYGCLRRRSCGADARRSGHQGTTTAGGMTAAVIVMNAPAGADARFTLPGIDLVPFTGRVITLRRPLDCCSRHR